MTAPARAAADFLLACGVGAMLGAFYGFLRPLRPRLQSLCDGIFVLAAFLAWVYTGFGIFGGQLGLLPCCALVAGALAWEFTMGALLRRFFSMFWHLFLLPFGFIFRFFRKFLKKLFAFRKKWVTIQWNNRLYHKRTVGGVPHGKKTRKSGVPQ